MHLLNQIIGAISGFALNLIGSLGYWGVFFLSLLESAAIPIPSEVVVPFAGFLAAKGTFTIWGVVLVATSANLVGSAILYWIGKSGGRWILERYGKYVLITHNELETGDKWFLKHGSKAVFWSRMLPVIRTFISLPAGVARMPFVKFSLFTFLGSLPWNGVLAYVGFKTGENWAVVHERLGSFNYLVVGVIIVLIVWFIWRRLRNG